jgi:hypothetical protein
MKSSFVALFLSAILPSLTLAQTSPHAPAGHGHPTTGGGLIAAQAGEKADALVPLTPPIQTAAPAKPQLPNEGTVVSTMDAGGYSYIEVSGAEGNTWLAAPATKVKAGDKIRFENGAVMRNFSSRSLGRTFPTISFIGQVVVESK